MLRKLSHFLFPLLLLFFISFVQSDIEVNLQLQTSITCSGNSKNDSCDLERSFCNSAGKCQCSFGYSPTNETCERFECQSRADCSKLYQDSNVTCAIRDRCYCLYGFPFDHHTGKCMSEKPNIRKLGSHCVADHQCGFLAECTTGDECRCPAGKIPESDYTCTTPRCFTDEDCHNVTANTVCTERHDGRCECRGPYFAQNNETFACERIRQESVNLGKHCDNSEYCGDGAGCTNGAGIEQICKCRLGYEATSDTVCEVVHCQTDEQCHKFVSPLTTCFYKGDRYRSYCGCKDGYYENHDTFTCSPKKETDF